MFSPDPTNFARAGARHPGASWVVLCMGIFSASFSALALYASWNRLSVEHDILRRSQIELATAKLHAEAAAQREARPEVIEAAKARSSVDLALRRSWSEFFACLESAGQAVTGRVSVESLRPQAGPPGEVSFSIMAVAVDNSDVIAYLRSLKDQPQVTDASLSSQRIDIFEHRPVVRFQVSLTMKKVESDLNRPLRSKESA